MGDPRQWGRGLTKRVPIPPEVLDLIAERMGGVFCEDCQALGLTPPPEEPLEVDHRQPLAKGGDNHHLNLTWRCRSHNRAKKDKSPGAVPTSRPKWSRRRS